VLLPLREQCSVQYAAAGHLAAEESIVSLQCNLRGAEAVSTDLSLRSSNMEQLTPNSSPLVALLLDL
jgi:hypothetical protein